MARAVRQTILLEDGSQELGCGSLNQDDKRVGDDWWLEECREDHHVIYSQERCLELGRDPGIALVVDV